MADSEDTASSSVSKAEASAEKAYAAAAEAAGDKAAAEAAPPAAEEAGAVAVPAKPKGAAKPRPDEAEGGDAVVTAPAASAAPVKAPVAKPAAKRKVAKPVAKSAVKRAAAKPAPAKARKPAAAKPPVPKIKTAPKAAPKTVKASAPAAPKITLIAQLKEIPMDVTASLKDAVDGAQEKAKEAFTKTSAAAAEYGEFAKGNVEAFVESGKILASGLQSLGNMFVADSKAAFETATADVKALSGVKSPTDFFKLQGEILRRNLDTAIAYGSKNSEAVLKLTSDVVAPLSSRVSLAVEKVKKAA